MTNKHIAQLVSADGKATAKATSAPGCFIYDDVPLENHKGMSWGRVFAEPSSGNHVEFHVTGEEYFAAVAAAIAGAEKSIYIAGWQVNFDVELIPGRTLFQCLETAIDSNPSLRIYVMPWLSPKIGVDTGDFETMLAIFQLNAGLPPPARAFALPAIAQSDMEGGLGIGFSHHQKLVVIDEECAFVGGIDLAYGRRDDGRFSLAAEGRTGNELYNTCIPPIHTLSNVEKTKYLTRAELLCACFDGAVSKTTTFLTSAPAKPLAMAQDAMGAVSGSMKDTTKQISDWWTQGDLTPAFIRKLQDVPIDTAQEVSRWAYRRLDREVQGSLERLRETGSAHVANTASALMAWLNNTSTEQLPIRLRENSIELIEAFLIATLSHLSNSAGARTKRYKNLKTLGKIVPASGTTLASSQPRMPWHDVQASIKGPAVSDLTRNFVQRWNGIACRYEKSRRQIFDKSEIKVLFSAFGLDTRSRIRLPRIAAPRPKEEQPRKGKSWVQVLRSAPVTMQRDEAGAEWPNAKKPIDQAQNNCLKAMLTAIHSAQKFIYIEGQFFQSSYGVDQIDGAIDTPSGPIAALTDVTSLAGYEKYGKQLGIYDCNLYDIPEVIRLSQIDDVRSAANGNGAVFLSDLDVIKKNIIAIKASKLMGKSQTAVLNPVGEALASRIETAIYDGKPFHLYMVLPVHPEGTLNTLNIMTQLHLTMQSLVFGSYSLVNRIRRAVLAERLSSDKKIGVREAIKIVESYNIRKVVKEAADDWKEYLTLLNLRNWQFLEKRPVTEQIYVHSKLLIVDDRVAILGSANINDRSQLGDRDSELAITVRDDEQLRVQLDGVFQDCVSANVHRLRTRLWKKNFGLLGSAQPAHGLASVIEKPAARATWEAIQRVAYSNALAYQNAFPFLAKIQGGPSSIWPTWDRQARTLKSHMPFNQQFWKRKEARDTSLSWEATSRKSETPPANIQGFIVALPVSWTAGENNLSGMNLSLLANNTLRSMDEGMFRV